MPKKLTTYQLKNSHLSASLSSCVVFNPTQSHSHLQSQLTKPTMGVGLRKCSRNLSTIAMEIAYSSIGAGLGFLSLILIATSLLFMFFVVLSGVTNSTPLSKTWFLQADTSHIPGSGRAISQWTYFFVCGANNRDCGSPVAGLPIGYAWVGGTAGAPPLLVG
jgi:hypothetical protein